jgi:hypothetical protein
MGSSSPGTPTTQLMDYALLSDGECPEVLPGGLLSVRGRQTLVRRVRRSNGLLDLDQCLDKFAGTQVLELRHGLKPLSRGSNFAV